MERINSKIFHWREMLFQRIFLIQEHNFDSYFALVIVFILQNALGINTFIFYNIEISSISILQKYLKYVIGVQILTQNIYIFISTLISLVIVIYLAILRKISLSENKNSSISKFFNQNVFLTILTNLTYLINALLIWLIHFTVHNILYSMKAQQNIWVILVGVLGTLQFIFLIAFTYVYEILFVSLSFKTFNMMLKYSTLKTLILKIVNIIIVIIIATGSFQQRIVQIVCICLTFASFGYRLYKEIFDLTFFNPFTKRVSEIASACNCFFSLAMVLHILLPLDLIQNNILTIFIVGSIFSIYSVQSYHGHHTQVISMSEVSELKTLYDARNYFEMLLRLKKDNSNQTELIMMSLIQAHRISCKNPTCYCKNKKEQFNSMVLNFSLQKWKLIQKQFSRNQEVVLMGKYFLYQCFQYYPQIIVYLEFMTQKQASIQFNYLKEHLKKNIKYNIQKKNEQKSLAQTQGPINLQRGLGIIMEKIKRCSHSFYQKYKYLAKGLCRVTQLESANQLQLEIMKQIQKFYQENKEKYKRSLQFSAVLYFFYSKVFMLSVRLNEIRRHLMNLRSNYALSNDTQLAAFKKSIYNVNCCSFQSSLSNQCLGIVTNASKNTSKLFGFDRKHILGKSINKILLSFMHQEHDRLLKEWYKTGKFNNFGVFLSSFCIDQQNKIFPVKAYLKLHICFDSEIRLIAMIKKQEKNNDIMVMNDKYVVEGFGQRISQLTGFESRKCPGQLLFVDFESLEYFQDTKKELTLYLRGFKETQYMKYIEAFFELKNNLSLNKSIDSAEVNHILQTGIKPHLCKFLVSRHRIGQKQFLSLQLVGVLENGYTKHNSGSFRQNLQSVLDASHMINGKSINQEQKARIQQIACESVNSSQINENYFIVKVMKTYFQFFINNKTITSNRINVTTYILFTLVGLIAAQLIAVHYFYLIGLNSVYQVCFADGAVSDNMQLFEFLYGNSMLMKQFNNTQELQLIHNSSIDTQNYVYTLLAYDMEYLFKSIVSLTKLPYYEYMRLPIQWKFPHQGLQIQSYQFLEYYYYLARESWKKEPTQNILNLFMINFPEMKRINHQNLDFYADQTMKVIFWLSFIFYLNIGLLLIISISIGVILHLFYYRKYLKSIQCTQVYSFLCHQQLEELKNYYGEIHECMSISLRQKNLNINAEQFTIPIIKGNKNTTSRLNIINNKKYISIFWIIIMVIIINVLNLISNLETQKLFQPSSDMVITMSELMDSENYLIQSYFQMKAHFLVGNQSKTIDQIADELLDRIHYDQLLFNIIAKDSLKLFKQYDPTYEKDFIDLLIDNICGIVDKNITDFQRWQCNNELHENLIDLGVVGGMNQFYRQVQSSLHMMKTIDMSNFDVEAYFKTKTVRQTDKNIFYMFKMYQTTQQRIMVSLANLIQDDFNNRFVWLVIQISIVLMLAFFWVFYIPSERGQIGKMYGFFLLIPQGVVAESKNLMRKAEEIMNDQ